MAAGIGSAPRDPNKDKRKRMCGWYCSGELVTFCMLLLRYMNGYADVREQGKWFWYYTCPAKFFHPQKKTTFIMYHIFILVTSWMCQNITAHRVNGGSSLANTLFLACLLYVLSYLLVIFFQGILKQLYFSKNSCLKVCFCYRLYIYCVVVTNAAYS